MAGQANHFLHYAPSMSPPNDLPYAQTRYRNEVGRLYSVLNRRLADREFVAGGYSIADMAIWPWARRWEHQQQDIERFPHMAAWLDRIAARPAVQEAVAVGKDRRTDLTRDREAQKILFHQGARD
jgi:GST-like protein